MVQLEPTKTAGAQSTNSTTDAARATKAARDRAARGDEKTRVNSPAAATTRSNETARICSTTTDHQQQAAERTWIQAEQEIQRQKYLGK